MDRRDVTRMNGIPITTVPRTIVDLAAYMSPEDLAIAVHQANIRYRTQPQYMEAVLARRPRARGAGTLRAVLRGDTRALLSKLEAAFIALLLEEDLPLPRVNRKAGSHYVDCRWPEYRLTVELDSYRFHSTRHAWEQDHDRRREAHARGDRFRRYTWRDVVEDSEPTRRELRSLLAG
jgi:hypothetical protein